MGDCRKFVLLRPKEPQLPEADNAAPFFTLSKFVVVSPELASLEKSPRENDLYVPIMHNQFVAVEFDSTVFQG